MPSPWVKRLVRDVEVTSPATPDLGDRHPADRVWRVQQGLDTVRQDAVRGTITPSAAPRRSA